MTTDGFTEPGPEHLYVGDDPAKAAQNELLATMRKAAEHRQQVRARTHYYASMWGWPW